MPRLNIAAPEFDYDASDPEGFRAGLFRFGKLLGAEKTGCSIYELPPGQAICPYHYEYGEEEWLLVLEGRPTLRTPEGEEEIGPWEMVFFPTGPAGAHSVRNHTDTTARVLMFSTRSEPAVAVYPDSGKIGVFTGNEEDDLLVRKSSGVDYWDGETGPQSS
ncbi:MAG: cupin domain-containing protein [Actinomycetota bacterium]|nr:cupin domain-containing protein [Actinomycetota bacterium]